jgi:glycosyltransferase involved in cell wall biosynthesis
MISVVMATYNGAEFIEKQMESIRKQTVLPDEVLFCDDNSSDNTVDIIESYINQYQLNNWKIIINKNNLGYYMNFINGANLTRGDTIYFADQDDIWNIHKIEASENAFSKNKNVMMVQTNYMFIDQNDNKLQMNSNYHRVNTDKEIVELLINDMCKFAGSGFTMGFKRDVILCIYSKKLYEIKEFQFHDILVGLSAACLGKCLYLSNIHDEHRLHLHNATQKVNQNVTSKRTKSIQIENFKNRKKYFTAMKKVLLSYKDRENPIEKIDALNKFINFNDIRINYYNTRKIKYFIGLLRNIKCYYDWKAIVADILFAFNINSIVEKYLKN